MAKCLERLGDSFNQIRMDARAVKPVEPGRILKTPFGVITEETQFVAGRRGTLGFKYKAWTKRNGIEWVSKGNNPVLYEQKFLNSLAPTDFTGLQEIRAAEELVAELSGPKVKIKGLLPTEVVEQQWKAKKFTEYKDMSKGAQRKVTIVTDENGVKFVEKSTFTGNAHPEEMIYYNVSDSLGMDIVPKTAQWNRGQFGDVLVQEFAKAPTGIGNELIAERGQIKGLTGWIEKEAAGLRKFVLETKSGRDWNFMDYVMGQIDRNRGNFVYNLKDGIITDFKLIDNNSALMRNMGKLRPDHGDFATSLALDKGTKAKLEVFLKDMGYKGKKSWGDVHGNLATYFERQGMEELALERAENVVSKLRVIVENDFKVPFSDAVARRVLGGVGAPITDAQIAAGDKILHAPKVAPKIKKVKAPKVDAPNEFLPNKAQVDIIEAGIDIGDDAAIRATMAELDKVKGAPKPVVEAPAPKPAPKPAPPATKPLKTDIVAKEWEGMETVTERELAGGAQREVKLVTEKGGKGRKFVEKFGEAEGNKIEMMYSNVAEELDMNVVPKVTKLGEQAKGSLNSHIRQEFVDMPTGFENMRSRKPGAVTRQFAHLREHVIATKDGRDWNLLDYLFDQSDRHAGNFVYSLNKSGDAIKTLRLIDNNTALGVIGDVKKVSAMPGAAMPMPASTREAYKKWLKSMGWKEGEAASWSKVESGMKEWFERHGLNTVPERRTKFVARMKTIVDADFHMPFAKGMKGSIYDSAYSKTIITDAEIEAGTAKIDKLVTAPKKVVKVAPKHPNKAFADKIASTELEPQQTLRGGRQRQVTLNETDIGEKVVVKVDNFAGVNPPGMNNEQMFSDFAHDLGMDIVPKITKTAKNTLVQEFTEYPVRTKIKVAADIMVDQTKKFIRTTKPGKDWGFMDNLFGAFDRHAGNYALKMEKGKIIDVRLIDNNDLNFKPTTGIELRKSEGFQFVSENVALDPATKAKLKDWLGKMGWTEKKSNWAEVSTKIRAYMKERGIVNLPGAADYPGNFISGIQAVVHNDFKFIARK